MQKYSFEEAKGDVLQDDPGQVLTVGVLVPLQKVQTNFEPNNISFI